MATAMRSVTFCGHCGALLPEGATFCGRCGAGIAVAAAPAPLEPPPFFATLGAAGPPLLQPRSKLSHRSLFLAAGGGLAVLVVLLTVVAVSRAVSSHGCGFFCGPHTGPRLGDPQSFTDTKWGFTIDYSRAALSLNTSDPTSDTVEFIDQDQNGNQIGDITFTGMPATSTQQAVQSTLQNAFPSSTYQDVQTIEAVPGAEVGLVQGDGVGASAVQSGSGGASGNNVTLMVLAATHDNTTVVVTIWGETDQNGDAPFYLGDDQQYDAVITGLHFNS